jgi:hypothetical protein
MKLIKTALLLRIRKFLPEDVQLTEAVAFKAEPRDSAVVRCYIAAQ